MAEIGTPGALHEEAPRAAHRPRSSGAELVGKAREKAEDGRAEPERARVGRLRAVRAGLDADGGDGDCGLQVELGYCFEGAASAAEVVFDAAEDQRAA